MVKKLLALAVVSFFILTLNGCATTRRQKDLETQGLRNQIAVLEAQLQSKDDEINSLRESLARMQEMEKPAPSRMVTKVKKAVAEAKSRPKAKDIQTALRNAGYDPGSIDGRIGRQTREAIRAFQRANGLAADGRVGKQTWALLKEYLAAKIK